MAGLASRGVRRRCRAMGPLPARNVRSGAAVGIESAVALVAGQRSHRLRSVTGRHAEVHPGLRHLLVHSLVAVRALDAFMPGMVETKLICGRIVIAVGHDLLDLLRRDRFERLGMAGLACLKCGKSAACRVTIGARDPELGVLVMRELQTVRLVATADRENNDGGEEGNGQTVPKNHSELLSGHSDGDAGRHLPSRNGLLA